MGKTIRNIKSEKTWKLVPIINKSPLSQQYDNLNPLNCWKPFRAIITTTKQETVIVNV